jgi:translocation and assembly module TamA
MGVSAGGRVLRGQRRPRERIRQPVPFGWDGTLVGGPSLVRDRLESYDRDAFVFNLAYERRLGERWTLSSGPVAEIGQSGAPGGSLSPYQLAGWAFTARYDSTQNLLDPRGGIRAQGSLTPSYAFQDSTAYLPLRLSGSTYFDVTGDGRSILALRGALGSLVNATAANVPPSQRFYAGGGGSVRGYDFQSIGPRTAQGKPAGGASLLEGSIEWRQRFGESFGGVIFADLGAVGTESFAPTDELRVGAGVGFRYYTAIGPIRADLAVPLVKQQGSGSFGFYIGIGQSF